MFGHLPPPRHRSIFEFQGKTPEEVADMLRQERKEWDAYRRHLNCAMGMSILTGILWAIAMTIAISAVSLGLGSIVAKHI